MHSRVGPSGFPSDSLSDYGIEGTSLIIGFSHGENPYLFQLQLLLVIHFFFDHFKFP